MKIYCSVFKNYRKLKNPKLSSIFKKALDLPIVYSKCGHKYQKIFKEEDSNEILKVIR